MYLTGVAGPTQVPGLLFIIIILVVTVFQPRVMGVPKSIIGVEDWGEEGIKCLSFVILPVS